MLLSSINVAAVCHIPLLCTFFFFILIYNIIGLVPFGFCVTSQIIITQFLGCLAVFGLFLKGIQHLRLQFINVFIPRNVPIILLPFLAMIECISFISRMFSLSIRLFANMVAGHALLHILMGAVVSFLNLALPTLLLFIFVLVPSLLLLIIFCLEVGIGFLQSYVFVVLFSIYLADAYKAH
jgi:F-type H+-transporting ATPase subunit a